MVKPGYKSKVGPGVWAVWSKGTFPKKYKVVLIDKNDEKIKTVQFGDQRYEQWKDQTPLKLYKSKNHNDSERRKNYRTRHSAQGYHKVKYSPAWFSYYYLW